MEIKTTDQAKKAIMTWLSENGHEVTEIKTDENANFHYEIDYPIQSQKRQRIIQPKEYPGLIVILNGVGLAPEHMTKIGDMTEEEREALYSQLRRDLIFLDNSYDINRDEKNVAKQIQFSYELYFDGLSKTSLFKGLLLNHRTLLHVVSEFNDKFGVPVMPDNSAAQSVAGNA
jgi:hypothetical protein